MKSFASSEIFGNGSEVRLNSSSGAEGQGREAKGSRRLVCKVTSIEVESSLLDFLEGLHIVLAQEGGVAAQEQVRDDPDCPQVGGETDQLRLRNLGRHEFRHSWKAKNSYILHDRRRISLRIRPGFIIVILFLRSRKC